MTTASKIAYFNPDNKVRRLSHKQMCYNALVGSQSGLTYIEVASKVDLSFQQTWKRVSDLHKEDKLIIIGTRALHGRKYSIYKINNEPKLFYAKKLTLKKFVQQESPELWHKWEVLQERKL